MAKALATRISPKALSWRLSAARIPGSERSVEPSHGEAVTTLPRLAQAIPGVVSRPASPSSASPLRLSTSGAAVRLHWSEPLPHGERLVHSLLAATYMAVSGEASLRVPICV